MGTLTESMVRLRDEIVTLREKRALGQAELVRATAERRAGVDAFRAAFSRDRAVAHRSWFGPTAGERRAAELHKERRLAEEVKARAQAEHHRKLAEEAKAQAQAEHDRKLAEEAEARMAAEPKDTAEETVAAPAVAKAMREHNSSGGHPASSKHKASKRHSSK